MLEVARQALKLDAKSFEAHIAYAEALVEVGKGEEEQVLQIAQGIDALQYALALASDETQRSKA